MKRTRISTHYFSLAISSLFLLLTGCNSPLHKAAVESPHSRPNSTNQAIATSIDRLDADCHAQVLQRENSVGATADIGQQIALANAATRCIENKSFFPKHPENEIAMQLNALALVNFIKAGESKLAEHSLAEFRTQFPQQDLLFADYTSFVDTAVALLKHDELSAHQLQVLNINTALRNELTRQNYWLKN